MSKTTKQALQIAIDYMNERLEDHDCKYQRHPATEAERINILADIETVKEALAKQEQGEPVDEPKPDGVVMGFTDEGQAIVDHEGLEEGWVLYTTPQQRKPLTDEEIGAILEGVNAYGTRLYTFARAIEAAHDIKE